MTIQIGSYENTIKAEAKARRIRLMGVTKPVNYKPEPIQKDTIRPYLFKPITARRYEDADSHVRLWNWYRINKHAIDALIDVAIVKPVEDNKLVVDPAQYKPKRRIYDIVQDVITNLGTTVTMKELVSDSRFRHVVEVRHRAMFEVRIERPDLSYPAIGRFFGNRDHTSVLFAVKKMAARLGATV